jgi:glutamate 5-kinase
MRYKRVVIKVGSSILSENDELARDRIFNIVELIGKLRENGMEVILVTSGAVAAGYTKVKLDKTTLANRQALASIGQSYLMSVYQKKFDRFNIKIAQILLIKTDFDSRKRSQNAKNTIDVLLKNGVLPIINENDTVATEELAFGDNDQLSAHSAFYFDADLLVILSDIDGLYDKNPHVYVDAKIRLDVKSITKNELSQEVSPNNKFATGGIVTKLKSAKFLLERGGQMFLTSGFNLKEVENFLLNESYERGTLFKK